MTSNKKILIKNIYYMLTYAFQALRQVEYDSVAKEEFEDIEKLFAEILIIGINQQIKKGLYREYVVYNESLSVIRGKIDITETIKNKLQKKQRIACEFDDFSENNLLNQIIKTVIHYLLKIEKVKDGQKDKLEKILLFFNKVELLEPFLINWKSIQYHRHNQSYEMMINLCRLLFESMIQSEEKGEYKMQVFTDEKMSKVYEKFILEYYKHHFPCLNVSSPKINWVLDEENKDAPPEMRSDIVLADKKNNVLIIDAKYYGNNTKEYYGKISIPSGNLYQIFTYVKNKQLAEPDKKVSGLLLYAKTEKEIQPNVTYLMSGSIIETKTLDLNCDFSEIKKQLDAIAEEFFSKGLEKKRIKDRKKIYRD